MDAALGVTNFSVLVAIDSTAHVQSMARLGEQVLARALADLLLVSVVEYGVPPPVAVSELVLPPILVWWISRVTDTSAR